MVTDMINGEITTDEDLVEVKDLLNLKFLQTKNDINITNHILEYLTGYCDSCEYLCLIDNVSKESMFDCYESDCEEPNCGHDYLDLCFECKIDKDFCIGCKLFFCNTNQDKRYCDNEECQRKNHRVWCEECKCNELLYCGSCEEYKCCVVHYSIQGNRFLICKRCKDDNVMVLPKY